MTETDIQTKQTQSNGLDNKYLIFLIDDTMYSFPLASALEILTMQPITKLPMVSSDIKGIINLRGKVIPVLDVRQKLGLPEKEYDSKTSIIVLDIHGMHIGLIVDIVSDVMLVKSENIIPPPKKTAESRNYISSVTHIDDKIVLNLDCDLFFNEELKMLVK